jgi:hypothetical protein
MSTAKMASRMMTGDSLMAEQPNHRIVRQP